MAIVKRMLTIAISAAEFGRHERSGYACVGGDSQWNPTKPQEALDA